MIDWPDGLSCVVQKKNNSQDVNTFEKKYSKITKIIIELKKKSC